MATDAQRAELAAQLARVALGDRAAFARVYELTNAHLFGLAQRILNNQALAEDVLQEAFVNVWKSAPSYNAAVSQPMTWLITIVRNRCLDVLRSNERKLDTQSLSGTENDDESTAADIDLVDESAGPLDLLQNASDALQIRACMDTLDARVRQSLALAYYQGLSNSEVAEHLSSPLGSVKTWLRRGLQQLKRCVESATSAGNERGAAK
jgi:RNA polymerase sigma-70 factor, ECF subfamily